MPSLISHLQPAQQGALLEDLNYLNMAEIKTFCKQHSIPYSIWFETEAGESRRTAEDDRKGIILKRVRHYLTTGEMMKPTRFRATVVRFDKLSTSIAATDRLFYGQYDKKNRALMGLLGTLTNGQFKDGAVARILMNEFWRKGTAPTFRDFAAAWLKAKEDHKRPNPEWAFLSDRADRKDTKDWKQLRSMKAERVLRTVATIAARPLPSPPPLRRGGDKSRRRDQK